ncbi:sensor histidine kinase [Pseudoblastomonas halimionae]|uniref:Sensor histidine kinase n=1 Tax=Alteriqipengyuania halimionae TaxID=1926630 RepID=A0A6I4U7B7_9SPHN|nr:histidine kinase [Alteriqipengyuania halimionae]MXP10773.1 sensor histidine kinase [Alteriqipengyuania halimionae]
MPALPVQPTPFFANKNEAFWRLQLAGWGGVLALRGSSAIANDLPWSFLVVLLVTTITGFSISLVLSVIYRMLINRRPFITWTTSVVVLVAAVSIWTFVDTWVNGLYRPETSTAFAQRFIGLYPYYLVLLGAWSSLYYAINFFLQVEEQQDKLQTLESQATSAQLAMLRYQLNPHFLFNTLNSISTLVLLKQTTQANAMLSRLSSFLRYTLINEPGGRVTVEQEIDTLKLYLDIERMRFEDRLRTRFRIDDDACDALMPSLLLQPLVENSIKYAVSPQESGAEIRVDVRMQGPMLRIMVSDTGPGLKDSATDKRLSGKTFDGGEPVSTGVGLANIRNRLAQAYEGEHHFEIREPAEGGFGVVIEIPAEFAAERIEAAPVRGGRPADTQGTEIVPPRFAQGKAEKK